MPMLKKFQPKELDEVKMLYVHAHGPGLIHTAKKPVTKLEDLKGMKIRSTGLASKIITGPRRLTGGDHHA